MLIFDVPDVLWRQLPEIGGTLCASKKNWRTQKGGPNEGGAKHTGDPAVTDRTEGNLQFQSRTSITS